MKSKSISSLIPLSIGVLTLSVIIGYTILAWTEPTAAPTGSNVNAPLNTGNTAQTKTGALTLGDISWTQLQFYPSVNDTWNPITGASDTAHFHFSFPSTPAEKKPLIEIPGDVWAIGADKNITADGYLKAGAGICIGADCKTSWPGGIAAQSCPDGQAMIGIDASGNIICSSSGFNPFASPCSETLATGNKRVFVTGSTYAGSSLSGDAAADNFCQDAAFSGNMTPRSSTNGVSGPIFRAFVYLGGRDPASVLPAGAYFWNGLRNGTDCTWNVVATSPADFFTLDDATNYLKNPITYDQTGSIQTNLAVWTNFKITSSGSYSLLGPITGNYPCGLCCSTRRTRSNACWGQYVQYSCTSTNPSSCIGNTNISCTDGVHWYGTAGSKTSTWSFATEWRWSLNGSSSNQTLGLATCNTERRALYCVEQ